MYDVIVVGARCAGSPLAMLLARKGYRVLLVDKARFPSDTVSTHVLWQAGLARAKRWGLLDKIGALAPHIQRCSLAAGPVKFSGTPPPLDGIDYFMAPRRTLLDKLLVDEAVKAGAELRDGCYLSDIVTENGRVTGVRGTDLDERAKIVVGADGTHSMVAHAVKAKKYNERPSTAGGYYSYWRGPDVTDFEIYFGNGLGGALFPTNDGLTCIVASWTDSDLTPENGYRKFMETIPRAAEFLKHGEQVEPLHGKTDLPGFLRDAWGAGWALAGDAGYHKHPLSAQGISDAFRDADFLSAAIDDGLSGTQPLDEALADYQRRRDQAVIPMYESTCARATLAPPPPEHLALFQALQHNQNDADRFFGTDAGTVPIPEFFAPENLARIVGLGAAR